MGYSKLPYTAQVFCVKRPVTDLHGQNLRSKVAYGITSLSPHKADPASQLSLNRHHWSIENRVHWVRDVPIDEDRSQVRKNAGPNVMARCVIWPSASYAWPEPKISHDLSVLAPGIETRPCA